MHHLPEEPPFRPSWDPPSSPLSVSSEALLRREGRALGGAGRQGPCWAGKGRAASLPRAPGLGPAYLGMQALRSAGEDAGSLPAAGGEVQDGSSCC